MLSLGHDVESSYFTQNSGSGISVFVFISFSHWTQHALRKLDPSKTGLALNSVWDGAELQLSSNLSITGLI